MKTLFTLSLLIANVLIFSAQAQITRYVRPGASGDGSSWENASGSLQMMINASAPDDEVWVAEGVFTPTHLVVLPFDNNQPVDRRSTFTVHSGVKLYGGFSNSGSPGMADRDFDLYPTVLSGDIGVPGDSLDNCYRVMFFPATENAVVDGFTIRSGTANGNTATNDATSYVSSLSLSIANYAGAGMYMHNASNITVSNCTFEYNRATYGGGAVLSTFGSLEFFNCRFSHNRGGGGGGAISGRNGSYTISNCFFEQNHVGIPPGGPFPMPSPGNTTGGGAVVLVDVNLDLSYSHFVGNTASVPSTSFNADGGALYIRNGSHQFHHNVFEYNSSLFVSGGVQVCRGGAVYLQFANTTFENNVFAFNESHGQGGALSLIGGNHLWQGNHFAMNEAVGNGAAIASSMTTMDIVNNIFEFNTSQNFGGATHSASNVGTNRYVNNTFYANSSAIEGGAMYFDSRVDHVLNNIFWGNMASGSTTVSFADVRFYNSSGSTLLHNLRQDGSAENGNIIGQNPQFSDAENGDYTLLPASPCINTGANEHYMSTYSTEDFSGNPRIFGDAVDMGAYESQDAPTSVVNRTQYKRGLEVYPNPVESGSTLTFIAQEQGFLRIYDVTGKLCMESLLLKGANAMPVQLHPGVYVGVQGNAESLKLVVR